MRPGSEVLVCACALRRGVGALACESVSVGVARAPDMSVGSVTVTTLTTPLSADAMNARARTESKAMFSAASVSHAPVW